MHTQGEQKEKPNHINISPYPNSEMHTNFEICPNSTNYKFPRVKMFKCFN